MEVSDTQFCGRSFPLILKSSQLSTRSLRHSRLELSISYEDVRGKRVAESQVLDLRAVWSDAIDAMQLTGFRGPLLPFLDQMKAIRKSLNEISRNTKPK